MPRWRIGEHGSGRNHARAGACVPEICTIQYNVPKSTLARRTGSKNKIALGSLKHLGRFTTDQPADFELELKQHILDMESRFLDSRVRM